MIVGNRTPVVVQVNPIVMEASSPQDRKYMRTMSKEDIHQINGASIQRLYQTVLDKKNCDFGDIPTSKGDLSKVKYLTSTKECLKVLKELMTMNGIQEPGIAEIETAIGNVERMQPTFEYGFKTNQEYIIILYNTTVMAIVDATSMMCTAYMDYLVGPDQERFSPSNRFDKGRGMVALECLKQFNQYCKNGKMDDALGYVIREQKSGFIGTGAIAVTVGAIAALVAVVPLTRQLIYWYYRNKISISEYLEMQAQFLEMHKLAVENSKARSSSEKRAIIKKQERVILKLHKAADKLSIKASDQEDFMKKEMKKDNSLFTLSQMEKQISDNKLNGVGIQIV